MTLVIEERAAKALGRMPKADAKALVARLEAIAADPFGLHPYAKALKGESEAFRVYRGDWRALYRLDRQTQTMRVYRIDNRKDVYR